MSKRVFVAKAECYGFKKRHYMPGDEVQVNDDDIVPPHFVEKPARASAVSAAAKAEASKVAVAEATAPQPTPEPEAPKAKVKRKA